MGSEMCIRDRNRSVPNITFLFNNSCSEFIYAINTYSDSSGKIDDDIYSKNPLNVTVDTNSWENFDVVILVCKQFSCF